jgi:hypothetical protein
MSMYMRAKIDDRIKDSYEINTVQSSFQLLSDEGRVSGIPKEKTQTP